MENNEQELSFENWYDIYVDTMKQLGWTGAIDGDSATNDYNHGMSPEEAAKSLYDELNS